MPDENGTSQVEVEVPVVDQPEASQDSEPLQVVVVDGIEQSIAEEVARAVHDEITSQTESQSQQFGQLSDLLVGIQATQDRQLAETGEDDSSAVQLVTFSDGVMSQWTEHMARTQAVYGVWLFISLIIALMVGALLGNRLWAAFAEGWRR